MLIIAPLRMPQLALIAFFKTIAKVGTAISAVPTVSHSL